MSALPLVGRDPALAQLEQVVRSTVAGSGSALVIAGEPGVGKTSLLDAAAAATVELRVLRTRGSRAEQGLPYGSLQQLLQPCLELCGRLSPAQRATIEAALDLGRSRLPKPFVVGLAGLALLGVAAEDGPVLCVVDDLQWVDAASRSALLFVARRLQMAPISMLIAVREEDWAFLGERHLPTIELGGLDPESAAALLAGQRGMGLLPDVARRLHEATAGNPLGLLELARALSTDQLRGWTPLSVPLPVTPAIEDGFSYRIEGLDLDTRTLLLTTAADRSGQLRTVLRAMRVLGVPPAALDVAVAVGLLRVAGDDVRLRQPLVGSLVYWRAALEDRLRVHQALADVTRGLDNDHHAWQLAAASLDPGTAAADALVEAGRRAVTRGAFVEAANAFDRASEISTAAPARASMLFEAAQSAWKGGQPHAARVLLERARAASPAIVAGTEVEALRGVIELRIGDAGRAYRILVEAAHEVQMQDPARGLELLALAGEAAAMSLDYPGEIELGRTVAGWEVGDDRKLQVLREALIGFAAGSAGDLEASIGHLRRSIELARTLSAPETLLTAGRAAEWAGDDDRSYQFNLAIVEMARDRGSLSHAPLAGARLALAEIFAGNLAAGSVTATDALRLAAETGQAELGSHPQLWLALVHAIQGNVDLVERHLADALATAGPRSNDLAIDAARWVRGVLALGEGRAHDAMRLLEPISHPVIQTFSSLDRFEAAAATGDGRGLDWLSTWERFAESSGAACAMARLSHGRAILGSGPEEGEQHLLAALAYHAASRRPFELARTQFALGSLLRRNRQRARSREYLRGALHRFEHLGATRWAQRASAELRATGETVTHAQPTPAHKLTAQEIRIAQAVAEGRSNREVAEVLFLSPRTVDFHLRNVFAKLGVTSRTELARIAVGDEAHGPGDLDIPRA